MPQRSETGLSFLLDLKQLIESRRADEALALWRRQAARLENLSLSEGQRVREELRQLLVRTELLRDSLLEEHKTLQQKRRTSRAYANSVAQGQ